MGVFVRASSGRFAIAVAAVIVISCSYVRAIRYASRGFTAARFRHIVADIQRRMGNHRMHNVMHIGKPLVAANIPDEVYLIYACHSALPFIRTADNPRWVFIQCLSGAVPCYFFRC